MLEGTSKDKKAIRKHHVTLSDVAEMAGVSSATASLALNGKPVAEDTRQLVISVSKRLGFEPNPLAKRLSNGLNNSVVSLFSLVVDAITWHSMSFLHYALLARGYEAPLHTNGQALFGYPQHQTLWHDNPTFNAGAAICDSLLSSVCRQLPQALIINTDFTHTAPKGLMQYQEQGGIVLCINQPVDFECDQILFDRASNTRLAAEYLLKAGHTRIGLCSYLKDKNTAGRVSGFVSALNNASVPVNNDWLFEAGYNEEGGARLAEQFLALRERPTAICIVNDFQASSFINQLARAGVRVPDDVSVVSLDGLPASEYALVKLTTVTRPWEEIALKTIGFLELRIRDNNHDAPRKAYCIGEIIERESVRFL